MSKKYMLLFKANGYCSLSDVENDRQLLYTTCDDLFFDISMRGIKIDPYDLDVVLEKGFWTSILDVEMINKIFGED